MGQSSSSTNIPLQTTWSRSGNIVVIESGEYAIIHTIGSNGDATHTKINISKTEGEFLKKILSTQKDGERAFEVINEDVGKEGAIIIEEPAVVPISLTEDQSECLLELLDRVEGETPLEISSQNLVDEIDDSAPGYATIQRENEGSEKRNSLPFGEAGSEQDVPNIVDEVAGVRIKDALNDVDRFARTPNGHVVNHRSESPELSVNPGDSVDDSSNKVNENKDHLYQYFLTQIDEIANADECQEKMRSLSVSSSESLEMSDVFRDEDPHLESEIVETANNNEKTKRVKKVSFQENISVLPNFDEHPESSEKVSIEEELSEDGVDTDLTEGIIEEFIRKLSGTDVEHPSVIDNEISEQLGEDHIHLSQPPTIDDYEMNADNLETPPSEISDIDNEASKAGKEQKDGIRVSTIDINAEEIENENVSEYQNDTEDLITSFISQLSTTDTPSGEIEKEQASDSEIPETDNNIDKTEETYVNKCEISVININDDNDDDENDKIEISAPPISIIDVDDEKIEKKCNYEPEIFMAESNEEEEEKEPFSEGQIFELDVGSEETEQKNLSGSPILAIDDNVAGTQKEDLFEIQISSVISDDEDKEKVEVREFRTFEIDDNTQEAGPGYTREIEISTFDSNVEETEKKFLFETQTPMINDEKNEIEQVHIPLSVECDENNNTETELTYANESQISDVVINGEKTKKELLEFQITMVGDIDEENEKIESREPEVPENDNINEEREHKHTSEFQISVIDSNVEQPEKGYLMEAQLPVFNHDDDENAERQTYQPSIFETGDKNTEEIKQSEFQLSTVDCSAEVTDKDEIIALEVDIIDNKDEEIKEDQTYDIHINTNGNDVKTENFQEYASPLFTIGADTIENNSEKTRATQIPPTYNHDVSTEEELARGAEIHTIDDADIGEICEPQMFLTVNINEESETGNTCQPRDSGIDYKGEGTDVVDIYEQSHYEKTEKPQIRSFELSVVDHSDGISDDEYLSASETPEIDDNDDNIIKTGIHTSQIPTKYNYDEKIVDDKPYISQSHEINDTNDDIVRIEKHALETLIEDRNENDDDDVETDDLQLTTTPIHVIDNNDNRTEEGKEMGAVNKRLKKSDEGEVNVDENEIDEDEKTVVVQPKETQVLKKADEGEIKVALIDGSSSPYVVIPKVNVDECRLGDENKKEIPKAEKEDKVSIKITFEQDSPVKKTSKSKLYHKKYISPPRNQSINLLGNEAGGQRRSNLSDVKFKSTGNLLFASKGDDRSKRDRLFSEDTQTRARTDKKEGGFGRSLSTGGKGSLIGASEPNLYSSTRNSRTRETDIDSVIDYLRSNQEFCPVTNPNSLQRNLSRDVFCSMAELDQILSKSQEIKFEKSLSTGDVDTSLNVEDISEDFESSI